MTEKLVFRIAVEVFQYGWKAFTNETTKLSVKGFLLVSLKGNLHLRVKVECERVRRQNDMEPTAAEACTTSMWRAWSNLLSFILNENRPQTCHTHILQCE